MKNWTYFVFTNEGGAEELTAWLDSLPLKHSNKIRHLLVNQRVFQLWDNWFCDNIEGIPGLYELRFSFQRIQYRLLGGFGPGEMEFTIVDGVRKEDKIPKKILERASERIKIAKSTQGRRREYEIH